ncbi:hypothetical protein J4216_00665 [Candidatus Woesearchaeota archaeon]|nr:hypothetical protein [Candidatus Woesearchaeota archaeon]
METEVVKTILDYQDIFKDPLQFGRDVYNVFRDVKLLGLRNAFHGVPAALHFDHLRDLLLEKFNQFLGFPLKERMKACIHDTNGQRGYLPIRSEAVGQYGFTEFVERFTVGRNLVLGSPITPNGVAYIPNDKIREAVKDNKELADIVDKIITLSELIIEVNEKRVLPVLTSLAKGCGVHHGYFAARYVYGDSVIRLNHRRAINGNIDYEDVNGLKTSNVKLTDGSIARRGITLSPKTHICLLSTLLYSDSLGLMLETGDRTYVNYTLDPDSIWFSCGDLLSYELGGVLKSPRHADVFTKQTAKMDSSSIHIYNHLRPNAIVGLVPSIRMPKTVAAYPTTIASTLLWDRLFNMQRADSRDLSTLAQLSDLSNRADKDLFDKLLEWEKNQGYDRLSSLVGDSTYEEIFGL